MSYERLTKQGGFTENLDLTQEYGYQHIYNRLTELEDKLENGTLRNIKYKNGSHVFFISWLSGNVCDGEVIGWNEGDGYCIDCEDCLISSTICYDTKEAAEAKLKESQEKGQ